MRFYFEQIIVMENDGGNPVSSKTRIVDRPVLEWLDQLGVYHDLILSGSDARWLSEMEIAI